MLVAFGVILLMGIIVSDHLSAVRKQEPASEMGNFAPITALGNTSQNNNANDRTQPLPMPGEMQVNQPQGPQSPSDGINPGAGAVKPGIIATGPGATPPPDTFVLTPVKGPASNNDVIGRGAALNLTSDGEIPGSPAEKIHTVAKGDSLFSISKQYYNDGNQWKKIADANKLTKNSQLKLGMKLSIPTAAPKTAPAPAENPGAPKIQTAPSTQPANQSAPVLVTGNDKPGDIAAPAADSQKFMNYTVKNGDTLGTIAGKTLGSKNKWQVIFEANKDTLKKPEALKAGMVLKIPRGSAV